MIQQNILVDVENDRFDFKELISVYGRLHQFEKMDLLFLDNNYSKIIESKLKELYYLIGKEEDIDLIDDFFMAGFSNIKQEKPELYEAFKQIDARIIDDKMKNFLDSLFNQNYEVLRSMKQSSFLLHNNIFKAMLRTDSIGRYIVADNNKADLLWKFINSEYLRISNAKDFHANEVEDIEKFLNEILKRMDETDLGRIDRFKIKQLIESLEKLIEHLK
ncbi:hypothetical protein MGY74_002530 [Enterococcus faecalis]|nr:hypothetical protein [Enterococcus faecalis]